MADTLDKIKVIIKMYEQNGNIKKEKTYKEILDLESIMKNEKFTTVIAEKI